MKSPLRSTRRAFLAATAAAAGSSLGPSLAAAKAGSLPVGLELYSVRDELKQDPIATLRAVAKMGYDGVEFFSPYFDWTLDYAKQIAALLKDIGLRCFSTHNGLKSFSPEALPKAIDLNHILGSKFIVLASAGRVQTLDGWKKIAGTLTEGAAALKSAGLRAGYHNHQLEFTPLEGKRPMEVLAANTGKDVMLQLDVGTCLEAKSDPIAWINQNPGRIASIHAKEWSPETGYKALLGEGVAPWNDILAAAKKAGGLEYVLIEQEGSRFPALETAERCLAAYRKLTQA